MGLPLSDPSGLLSPRTFALQSRVLRKPRPAGQTLRQINSMFLFGSWQSLAGLRSPCVFHAWEVPGGSFLELQASSQASRMGDNGCRGNRARVHTVRRSCTDPGIISKKAHGRAHRCILGHMSQSQVGWRKVLECRCTLLRSSAPLDSSP